jgi:hypothetical protein
VKRLLLLMVAAAVAMAVLWLPVLSSPSASRVVRVPLSRPDEDDDEE